MPLSSSGGLIRNLCNTNQYNSSKCVIVNTLVQIASIVERRVDYWGCRIMATKKVTKTRIRILINIVQLWQLAVPLQRQRVVFEQKSYRCNLKRAAQFPVVMTKTFHRPLKSLFDVVYSNKTKWTMPRRYAFKRDICNIYIYHIWFLWSKPHLLFVVFLHRQNFGE